MTRDEIIESLKEARRIHDQWRNADDDFYSENQTRKETGGGRDWHDQWVHVYDAAIAELENPDD